MDNINKHIILTGSELTGNCSSEKTTWKSIADYGKALVCEACEFPKLSPNDIIVQTLYFCVDPALRCRLTNSTLGYTEPWELNKTVEGLAGVGVVVQSACPAFTPGTVVEAAFGWPWKLYFSANQCEPSLRLSLNKVDQQLLDQRCLTAPLSCVGMVGLTGMLSVTELCCPRPGDCCVVSDAASASAQISGQVAKLSGCGSVIGLCHNEDQCKTVTEELGFTAALSMNSNDLDQQLKKLCPSGVNGFVDYTSGAPSDAVILQMKRKGRIAVCEPSGQFSTMGRNELPPLADDADMHVDMNEIFRERFIALALEGKWKSSMAKLNRWYTEGSIRVKETVYDGLEKTEQALNEVLEGRSVGSMIVKVSNLDTEV